MSDLVRKILRDINKIPTLEDHPRLGEIEQVLLKHLSPTASSQSADVSPGEATYGDIIFTESEYTIGGQDSPVRFRRHTHKGKALWQLLEHEGQEISKRNAGFRTGMSYLMDEIHFCSSIFEIEKVSVHGYKIVRKNVIVDRAGNNPDFEVVERFGDIYFGRDNRYYLGSSDRGIYGTMDNGDGHMLHQLCKNLGMDVELGLGNGTRLQVQATVLRGLPHLLAKKVGQYSEQFKVVTTPAGWKNYHRLEPRAA